MSSGEIEGIGAAAWPARIATARRAAVASLLLGPWLLSAACANTFIAHDSFPGDTRAKVTDPGLPWRCIGKLSLPHHRFMTATLVGPDLVLTAAHGLVKEGRLLAGPFIFRPDFGGPANPANIFATVTRVWVGTDTPTEKTCRHADWAILQLDTDLGDRYGTMRVDDTVVADLAGSRRDYDLVSYDKDFHSARAAGSQTGGGFVSLDPHGYLLHDFSTDRGASGAPIFYFAGPGRDARMVALNVAEVTGHDRTLYGVPYSVHTANVAVASHEFFATLAAIRKGGASAPPGVNVSGGLRTRPALRSPVPASAPAPSYPPAAAR